MYFPFLSKFLSFPSQTISIFLGARDRLFVTWNLEAIDIFSKQALERIMSMAEKKAVPSQGVNLLCREGNSLLGHWKTEYFYITQKPIRQGIS